MQKGKKQQLNLRPSDSQFTTWELAAISDKRTVLEWARLALDATASTGVKVAEMEEIIKAGIESLRCKKG